MEAKFIVQDGIATLYLSGNIDIPGSETLKSHLSRLLENHTINNVHIDFQNVNFIGSCGIGRLLLFYNKFSARGGKLTITNVNPELTDIFKSLKLLRLFNISED